MFTVVCLALSSTIVARRLRRRNDRTEAALVDHVTVSATTDRPVRLVEP